MIVYNARLHGDNKPLGTYAGVIVERSKLTAEEELAIPQGDRALTTQYVVKCSPRTNHIPGVYQWTAQFVYALPHPQWEYSRIVHATVYMAEFIKRQAEEGQRLQQELHDQAQELAEARQAQGIVAPRVEPQGDFEPLKPTTWVGHVSQGRMPVMVNDVCLRLGATQRSTEEVQRADHVFRLWADAAASVQPYTEPLAQLGESLLVSLRLALHPKAAKDTMVQRLIRKDRYGDDLLGAAIANAESYLFDVPAKNKPWGKGSPTRASKPTEGKRCYACGGAGHMAYDCPDTEKQRVWLLEAKRPKNGKAQQ